jgi:type IV fimbrial biogenesis protein FimT
MKTEGGWTLIELLCALAVCAIVGGSAFSFLGGVLERGRASAVRQALADSLVAGAARATLSDARAVLCPSQDGATCSDGFDWSAGWLVFVDRNANREVEGGERIVVRQGPLPGRVRLHSTVGRKRIVFQALGGNAGSNVTFTLCDGRGPKYAATLVLSNNGLLRAADADPAAAFETCAR